MSVLFSVLDQLTSAGFNPIQPRSRRAEQVRKNVKYKQRFAVNCQTHVEASESVLVPLAL